MRAIAAQDVLASSARRAQPLHKMHFSCRAFCGGLAILVSSFLALSGAPASAAPVPHGGKLPVNATSADDPVLLRRLRGLSPSVNPDEARAVARVAYDTGRELAREWRVVWPPGLHNLLVHRGARKGGLCFQWAAELAPRLHALQLKTLTVHWAESFLGQESEHNVVVVTATGKPFHTGILLDNWRYGGRLSWGFVTDDREYEWKGNPAQLAATLRKKNVNNHLGAAAPSASVEKTADAPARPSNPAPRLVGKHAKR